MKDKVYIIVLNYRAWEDTVMCLESVLRNEYTNYQVIAIDNMSGNDSIYYIISWLDGTLKTTISKNNSLNNLYNPPVRKNIPYIFYNREEAENGGNRKLELELKWPIENNPYNNEAIEGSISTSQYPLILIQSGDNLGYAGGNNVGIRYALNKDDFKYIWILNNDTIVEKDSLPNLVAKADEYMKINGNVGIIGTKLLYFDDPGRIQSVGGKYNKWLAIPKHVGENETDVGQYDNSPFHFDYVSGASVFVAKDFIDDVGLMSEEYFLFFEELDWAVRGKKRGWEMGYCYKSRVYHKEGKSTGSSFKPEKRSYLSEFYQLKNRLVFTRKFYSKYKPFVYFGYLLSLLNGLIRGQFYRFRIIYEIVRGKRN